MHDLISLLRLSPPKCNSLCKSTVHSTMCSSNERWLPWLPCKLQTINCCCIHKDRQLTNIRSKQEKFAIVMKDNANLIEKVKDIEHQNIILEGETDTIGKTNYIETSISWLECNIFL